MKNLEFLVFSMLLFCFVMAGHMALQMTLNQDPVVIAQMEKVEQVRREESLRADLAEDRLNDFKGQVAVVLPQQLSQAEGKNQYPLRQLASVVTEPSPLLIERASGLLEKGKEKFRQGEFDESNSAFYHLIVKYPESVHIAEAYFLLAEGQFQSKDYEASIATIEKMISLFPENELTGFALLRLGRIYELQDRLEDASDIYKSVLANFKQPEWSDLQKQAQVSLEGVRL